jgi:hypothetical protein
MNLRIGRLGRLLAPAYGQCARCLTPWRFVREHSVSYGAGHGMFVLCEKCWAETSLSDRWSYYRTMLTVQGASAGKTTAVRTAVERDAWPA